MSACVQPHWVLFDHQRPIGQDKLTQILYSKISKFYRMANLILGMPLIVSRINLWLIVFRRICIVLNFSLAIVFCTCLNKMHARLTNRNGFFQLSKCLRLLVRSRRLKNCSHRLCFCRFFLACPVRMVDTADCLGFFDVFFQRLEFVINQLSCKLHHHYWTRLNYPFPLRIFRNSSEVKRKMPIEFGLFIFNLPLSGHVQLNELCFSRYTTSDWPLCLTSREGWPFACSWIFLFLSDQNSTALTWICLMIRLRTLWKPATSSIYRIYQPLSQYKKVSQAFFINSSLFSLLFTFTGNNIVQHGPSSQASIVVT